jgi:hypothetical protein
MIMRGCVTLLPLTLKMHTLNHFQCNYSKACQNQAWMECHGQDNVAKCILLCVDFKTKQENKKIKQRIY